MQGRDIMRLCSDCGDSLKSSSNDAKREIALARESSRLEVSVVDAARPNGPGKLVERPISPDLSRALKNAWTESRSRFGNSISLHIPGMFVFNGTRGRYRAVSITGTECALNCEHCQGSLLKTMPEASTPEALVEYGRQAAARGDIGILVTGGCDVEGRLPWRRFLSAIATLKQETALTITVHPGQIGPREARDLKAAGVDQALVDVIGDDSTAEAVYHLPNGIATIRRTMDSCATAGLEIAPHILFGLDFGREKGERKALRMLSDYPLKRYVVVVLMPTKGTPMAGTQPPPPESVAQFIAEARQEAPHLLCGLGCARPRGRYGRRLETLAIKAGVNSLAMPTEATTAEVEATGLEAQYVAACCSLGVGPLTGGVRKLGDTPDAIHVGTNRQQA